MRLDAAVKFGLFDWPRVANTTATARTYMYAASLTLTDPQDWGDGPYTDAALTPAGIEIKEAIKGLSFDDDEALNAEVKRVWSRYGGSERTRQCWGMMCRTNADTFEPKGTAALDSFDIFRRQARIMRGYIDGLYR
jgi:hypothetical protein